MFKKSDIKVGDKVLLGNKPYGITTYQRAMERFSINYPSKTNPFKINYQKVTSVRPLTCRAVLKNKKDVHYPKSWLYDQFYMKWVSEIERKEQ